MNTLVICDLTFLGIFLILISVFLIKNKSKIKKEGLLLLYHTNWGIKLINRIGTKHKKFLNKMSYVSVFIGYILMIVMVWMFVRIVWLYVFNGDLLASIKIPPITPLIPYLPQLFNLTWLPPFYFSYWIIVLLVIAVFHELFHGIFAKIYGVKTKTTGFGFFPFFLPIFLAAFVNLDEKIMAKKSSFQQRAVLSAGTFANILTMIFGLILMVGFFSLTYSPAGVSYDDYAYDIINITDISHINSAPINISEQNFESLGNVNSSIDIVANGITYFAIKEISIKNGLAAVYYNSPAIKNNLSGIIQKINGEEITSTEKLALVLDKYSPGEVVELILYNGTEYSQNITLEKNPLNESKAWIGISFTKKGGIISFINFYKNPNVYYVPSSDFAIYIYNLLWWLVFISFSVALINMLPMGIFDGGRFFYLTILSLTKSEKKAEKAFKISTKILLFLLFVMMFFWAKNLF